MCGVVWFGVVLRRESVSIRRKERARMGQIENQLVRKIVKEKVSKSVCVGINFIPEPKLAEPSLLLKNFNTRQERGGCLRMGFGTERLDKYYA